MSETVKKFKFDPRPYKYKKPMTKFFCPLCSVERAFNVGHRLTGKHYFQIFVVTAFASLALFPVMEWKGTLSFFVVWACFELAVRLAFRKAIPCPHCGFDASWYKKDVKIARRLVKDFWKDQGTHDEEGQASLNEKKNQGAEIQNSGQAL